VTLLGAFFCFEGLYFLITFLFLKKSIFQYFFNIEIKQKSFAYILFKILFLSIIPFLLTFAGYSGLHTVIILLLIINIISYLIKKKSIWELCAKTKLSFLQKRKYNNSLSRIVLFFVSIILIITSIQYVLLQPKEKGEKKIHKIISVLPTTQTPFPVSQILKKQYVRDIKKHKQQPFEYIVQLFENHDIVVLCERMHPEYTQWHFFSKTIFNDTFATKIGNIATEFGRNNTQRHLDSLLNNSFNSEEDRKKAFISLIRENGGMWPLWSNTNIYDFAVNLSKFNEKQDEKQKVNWFLCDVAGDWNNINNRQDWDNNNFKNYNRDSIMAMNIIDIFDNLEHTKLLAIVNTRHAYKENNQTTADYLLQKYGDKVAFVWINNVSLKHSIEIFQPYQMGILDAAAAQIDDSIWALSFSHSILGEDYFELLPHVNKWHLKMKDLFDGMIYCLPPSQHFQKNGYEYMLSDFADTLLKRNIILYGEENGKKFTNRQIDEYKSGKTHTWTIPYFFFFNLIYYIIHYFILFYLLFCLISILKSNKKAITLNNA
jgi:hypothetical protein